MTDASNTDLRNLGDLRREIDAADVEIHRLLMHRASVIERLIAAKQLGERGAAFRPDREADMMRRLAARHSGPLPLSIAEHIWREIIGTFTQLQAPYRILSARAGEPRVRDLLRYFFGFSGRLVETDDDAAAVSEVATGGVDLAVVALDRPLEKRWWTAMSSQTGPGAKIIAALPFLPLGAALDLPPAVVIGPANVDAPEETCVYAIEGVAEASASALEGFGRILASGPAGVLLASPHSPADIDSVIAPARAALGAVRPIGSLATPESWTNGPTR